MRDSRHWSPERRAEVERRILAGDGYWKIAKELGVSRNTLRRHFGPAEERLKQAQATPPSYFTVPPLPSSDLPLEDLIARRREESRRVLAADAARKLVPVSLRTPGPVGLMIFGDPHVDNPGCDFALLESHLEAVKARPEYLFAVGIGDLADNWPGRLQRLYAKSGTTVSDAWRLVEWMMRIVPWLLLIRGNHDCFVGDNDPLDWIMRETAGVDERHGVRISLQHPCGTETRIHARHDFKGHSQFNGLHGLVRETLFGFRDHLIVAGHRHFGEDGGIVMPDGVVAQLVRVSGYKRADDYARAGQYKEKPIHPSALVIIDPSRPEGSRDRVWLAPTVEVGVKMLDFIRAEYDGRATFRVRARA